MRVESRKTRWGEWTTCLEALVCGAGAPPPKRSRGLKFEKVHLLVGMGTHCVPYRITDIGWLHG